MSTVAKPKSPLPKSKPAQIKEPTVKKNAAVKKAVTKAKTDNKKSKAASPAKANKRKAKKEGTKKKETQRSRTKSSAYRGVSRCAKDGRWQARIRIGSTVRYLGRFKSEEKAAECYDEAAKKYHGVRAVLNFGGKASKATGSKAKGEPEKKSKKRRINNRSKGTEPQHVVSQAMQEPQFVLPKQDNNMIPKIDDIMINQGNIFRTGSTRSLLGMPSIANPLNPYANQSTEDLKALLAGAPSNPPQYNYVMPNFQQLQHLRYNAPPVQTFPFQQQQF
mmetsp:Transcript_13695/g.16025  ORF Transcript_13695/g.16025 Transcript_13695/m.16025 type:complete len:276 (-) Transcript_13695:212-1039(-)